MKHLYHGTNMIIHDIDLSKSRFRTDFGRGFYLGTNLGEARKWAISQSMAIEMPTVMRFAIDDIVFNTNDNGLKKLWFATPSVQWLNFVRDNRKRVTTIETGSEPRHDFDVVYGPIANDKVVDVIDEYIDGDISADEAILRVKVIPSVFQMSFHTLLALSYINEALTEYQLRGKNNSWSAWKSINSAPNPNP